MDFWIDIENGFRSLIAMFSNESLELVVRRLRKSLRFIVNLVRHANMVS